MITKQQFVRDQGFPDGDVRLYQALMFQPRAVGAIVAAAVLTQQPWIFLALGVILWWSTLAPAFNPFDVIYNVVFARRIALARLSSAPAPRRYSMGMGATVALLAGAAGVFGLTYATWALEVILVWALVIVVFTRFCLGAYMYRRLTAVPGLLNRGTWRAHPRT
jgi:Domain of unknown function (DUF4395)